MPGAAAGPRRRSERAMGLQAGKPLDRFEAGRSCAYPACDARLSRYNPNATCAAHGGWVQEAAPRTRRRGHPSS